MPSYDLVHYGLRPSKSVERKLFIECLQLLSKCGYYISEYKYVGMGSPHYIDFNLFHRHLYINEMLCAEHSGDKDRMGFNLPFGFVELEMKSIGTVIDELDRFRRHLVWLDYDYSLGKEVLQDLAGCVQVLAPGSILIVSVAADIKSLKKLIPDHIRPELTEQGHDNYIVNELNLMFERYMKTPIRPDATKKQVATAFSRAISNFLEEQASIKRDTQFYQLFNCRYTDGTTQMLTIGGLFDTADAWLNIVGASMYEHDFFTDEKEPIEISVPPLTVREKNWLDTYVIGKARLPEKMAFEIDSTSLKNYKRFYRHYPNFYEAQL